MNRRRIWIAASAALVLTLTGCGSSADPAQPVDGPASAPVQSDSSASGEVIGQGTVLQSGDGAPELCLGPVAESFPPQCSGVPLVGWDWDAAEQEETASGVTWGTYAVQGTWDGTTLTLTQPAIPLSLYDPMADIDPRMDESNPGPSDEAELAGVQADVDSLDIDGYLGSYVTNGYLWVQVVHDDGELQDFLDARYGADVVVVQSALRPVPSG
ncbi:hypothetical protein [Planctomonas psychrotolerans]|uniref:hypothetical protein n=1 Tax=Planctomonas psychrotolerans TaxID=2528712 RepID=UPI00123A933D|nr:hypothetical protein [Planctomonas psychrotolerans]